MRHGIKFLFFAAILFLSSCEKEDDANPELKVLAPDDGFRVELGDSLEVEVRARSSQSLTKLRLSFTGGGYRNALRGRSYDIAPTRSLQKSFSFPVEGELDGGSIPRILRATIVDREGGRTTEFVEGRVMGDPLRFAKAFVVLRPAPQEVKVFQFEQQQSGFELFKSLSMDFSGSASNSVHGELLIAGSHSGDLRAFDVMSGNERWTVSNQGASPYPYFQDLWSDRKGEWVLAPLGTERLEGFRGGSGPDLTVDALSDHFVREAALLGGRLLTEQEHVGSDPRQWVTYYASTGALGTQKQIPDRNIVAILEEDPDKALVLANEDQQGKLYRYDVEGRSFDQLSPLPSGPLKGGIRMSGGRSLLVHEQGLYVHERGSDILRSLSSDIPQSLAYDKVGDRVFYGEGKRFHILDADQGTVDWERSFQDSIEGVHVLYTR